MVRVMNKQIEEINYTYKSFNSLFFPVVISVYKIQSMYYFAQCIFIFYERSIIFFIHCTLTQLLHLIYLYITKTINTLRACSWHLQVIVYALGYIVVCVFVENYLENFQTNKQFFNHYSHHRRYYPCQGSQRDEQ